MGPVSTLFLVTVSLLGVTHATHLGCYEESVRRRHFSVSPGDYSPELMTTLTCMSNCGTFDYKYAAITSGKFCYCASTLPTNPAVSNSNCNIPCVGDTQQTCGGTRHVSVYSATKKISGLTIDTDLLAGFAPVGSSVNIDVSVSTGLNVIYKFDYDDGVGKSGPNATDMMSTIYNLPGEYTIHVYANDVNETFQEQVAATTVRIDAPPMNATIECEDVFGTYEEGTCSFNLLWGTNVKVDVTVNSQSLSFSIADPVLSIAGPALQTKATLSSDAKNAVYFMRNSEFTVKGVVIGWEMIVETPGPIKLLILKPLCSSTVDYCYSRNSCPGICDSYTSKATACPSGEHFCAQAAMCGQTCTPPVSRDHGLPSSFEIMSVVTVTASSVGYQYIPELTNVEVEPGYTLGLEVDGSGAILKRQSSSNPIDDLSIPYEVTSVGDKHQTHGMTTEGIRHSIRAIASGGSKVYLPLTFEDEGNFTLTATTSSENIAAPAEQATTVVTVLEGVNASIVTGPMYAKTTELVSFVVEPHTGKSIRYNWTFSDGDVFLESFDQTKTHSFAVKGNYTVSVSTYNPVSSKSNSTEIIIQDEVTSISLTAPPTVLGQDTTIAINIATGSDYYCVWDYGDSSTLEQTSETATPTGGATQKHTYGAVGTYTVTVVCTNDVSSASSVVSVDVQEAISNLKMISEGANKNDDFYLEWEIDAGTSVSFELTFDGIPITTQTQTGLYKWRSRLQSGRPPSSIPLTLTASNLVSNETINVSFKILTVIVNPTFTSDVVNASSHEMITFTADMDAGSDVTIRVNYGDSNIETFVQPANSDWSGPQTFTHTYVNGGIFDVVATFSNAEKTETRTVEINVLVGVGSIDCQLDRYALYHPPANVDLMFVADVLPTEPTLTLNWGQPQSRDEEVELFLNKSYPHVFGDTGTFTVTAKLENLLGSKTCKEDITIVEKLESPRLDSRFPKAAKDMPFEVLFCLYRGPSGSLCNLTYEFGPSDLETQRKGEGRDGCDSEYVTYTTYLSGQAVKVTARTPLESVVANMNVDVIDGINDADVVITAGGDVSFNSPTTFTLQYNGSPMPTNPTTVTLDFGDGSTKSETFTITSASGTQTFIHTFTKDGLFEAKITVSNDATAVERIIQAGVYQDFSNLRAEMFFLADKPPGTETNGFNGLSKLFPKNKPIYFKIFDDNNAYALAYDLTATHDSGGNVVTCTHNTSEFSLHLNETGSYTIDIVARNPMYSKTVSYTSVTLMELVEGFSLTELERQVKKDEVKAFNVTFDKVGTETCLYVDFGDGMQHIYSDDPSKCTLAAFASVAPSNKFPLTGVTNISTVYSADGYYVVTATAKNSQSEETQVVGFSITGIGCTKPEVDIDNRKAHFTNPTLHKRSDKIKIRGMSNIYCVDSYENVKSWRAEKMDEDYDTVISNISLAGLETSKAELNLPARFFDLGLYRIHYTMTMEGSYGSSKFVATTYTYVKIDKSELVGIMMKGGVSEIIRGQSQVLTLDPESYSLDPDVDPGVPQGLTVKNWTCITDVTGCNNAGFTPSGSTQTLNIGAMQLQTYILKAFLEKDTRETSTEIRVTVVTGAPPSATIVPAEGSVFYQLSDGFKVLKSSRLALDCLCPICTDTDVLDHKWKVNLADYRWPDGWRPLDEEDMDGRVLGSESKQISIQAELFETFDATRMRVECEITRSGQTGKVATNLQVNTPPIPGTCTISPYNRTITTEEAWTLTVAGWSDDDGIEEYQFFIHTDDSTVDKQITSVETSDSAFTIQVSLSEGPDYNDYQQDIIVKVRDSLGAIQDYDCGTIIVRPMPVKDIRALANDIKTNKLHELQKIFAEGDQKTCSEKSTNIMSLLNSDKYAGQKIASNFVNSMYGETDEGRPSFMTVDESIRNDEIEYELESQRNDRSLVRKSLIADMTKLETKSVIAIQQVSSFFAEATVYGDEISQESQKTVMEALENMTDFMIDPDNIDKVPSEDIEIAMENGIAAMGGIMDAAGHNGFAGTLSELDEAQEDEQWFVYDTNIGAIGEEDDLSSAESFEDAMAIHTAKIHKIRMEKTAEKVREKVIRTVDKQVKAFDRYSVPGQKLEMTTLKMKMTMEKTDVENLQGKAMTVKGSDGGVVMPNTTFLSGVGNEDPIVVALAQSTNHPIRYSNASKGISSYSNFVSVNLYKADNSKVSVNNLPVPVKITIPRDSNMPEPEYTPMNPLIPSWSTLMTAVVTINRTQSSLHLDFTAMENRQFLLVIKKGKLANIAKNESDDECDDVYLIPPSMNDDSEDKYRFHLDNTKLGGFTGTLSIGIRELNSTEFDMDISRGCAFLPRYENGSDYFRGNFSMRQYVTQCLAISDEDNDWTTDGCVVGKETTPKSTVCYCNHLTTFAGGWVVVPNTIDWSYVFANADFLKNPTIYITVIITAVIYFIAAAYARYRDKKIAEQLGIAPLADNDPKDKYFYEVLVCTGMRRNAGTDSQVCFILSGEDDETDVRAFSDSKRKIFRRGQVDGFLMAVPRPLGYLNFMRMWHDNSGRGKFGSWYCNYVVVRDVQTDQKQVFVCNKWFAVEEDDGQVDRVIPVAGKEQLSDFSYQFGERSRKNLSDGHLWFSVVARPPQSRFTCLQRVSCCLCLLYVTMLANAMFYNTTNEQETASNSFSFGPFSVSPEQIFIGVISNLIVFPVNFLLIFLFRKSRPHHKRPSRIDRAIKEVHDQSKQASINDVKPEVSSIFSVSKTPTIPKDPHRPDTSASRPGTAMTMNSATEELTPKKKKKFELPWYFTIIAWTLLWVVTLGALAMVIFYGISFKDDTCRKWISSMLISFFMSVFITQPLKVFLFAIILSLIIKNPGEETEDEEEDEENPHVDPDSELLHGDVNAYSVVRPRKVGYKPPDPELIERLRQKRLKEIKMWAIVREVIIYTFFLWILMVISFRQLGASNFLYKDTMHRVFIANNETNIDFHALQNTNEFWIWAKSGLVNGLRAGSYYNDYPPLKLRAYINDKVSRIIGYATMRQLRIKPAQCEIPDKVDGLIDQCNINYDVFKQEEKTFKVSWEPMGPSDTVNDTREEYTYSSADSLNGYPYWGTLAVYAGGGYVVPLIGSKKDLIDKFDQLEKEQWIDRYTRAVFVEFTVYNPQVNLFAISTILAEFHPSGGLAQSFRFEPAMLLPYMTNAMLFQLVCEVVYILFTLFFIIRELRSLIKERLNYFKNFWNLVEVGIISMSIAAIVIFFYRLFVTNDLTKAFKETNGNDYVKFQYVGYWNEMFSYMIGFLVFLATLKFLKLLRFNKKISMLSATLRYSAKSLLHFSIIFMIVFLAFSQLFYLTYMHIDIDYSTFVSSVVASILMMMGKFNIYSMTMAEPVLTQVFVLLFVVTVTFIIVNIFVSILNETFTAVREDLNKQGNDYEIVDFMLNRFKKWTGIGTAEDELAPKNGPTDLNNMKGAPDGKNGSDCVEDFPDRIERLLQSISSVYMDNDNIAQMYQKKPFESQTGNKNLMRTGRSPSPAPGQRRRDSSDVVARVHTH